MVRTRNNHGHHRFYRALRRQATRWVAIDTNTRENPSKEVKVGIRLYIYIYRIVSKRQESKLCPCGKNYYHDFDFSWRDGPVAVAADLPGAGGTAPTLAVAQQTPKVRWSSTPHHARRTARRCHHAGQGTSCCKWQVVTLLPPTIRNKEQPIDALSQLFTTTQTLLA